MDYDTVSPATLGHALTRISVNILVRDVPRQVGFLTDVLSLTPHQVGRDFAIMVHAGQPLQLHSDAAYSANPLLSLLPEGGPRGCGIEIRLHECDPDAACQRAAGFDGAMVLRPAVNREVHGLREAVILCPHGYAWVPSRRI